MNIGNHGDGRTRRDLAVGELREALKFESFEKRETTLAEVKALLPSPNRDFRRAAKALIAEYREGDLVYWYRTPEITWQRLAGAEGYALVRDDLVIANLVTVLS